MNNKLGDLLKQYRKQKFPNDGLRKTASKVGVSFAHLNKMERGLIPSVEMIDKLVKAYELNDEQKFELLKLADLAYKTEEVKEYFNKNPEKLKAIYLRSKANINTKSKNNEQINNNQTT
jgi:transcriptional regulator with XRE-family HTH domain